MTWRIRRSAVAALRVSLVSVGGALGWLALSAGAATADDGGSHGLIGSVDSVVESATAPVASDVDELSAPVETVTSAPSAPMAQASNALPPASDVVAEVPGLLGEVSLAQTAAPATEVIDAVVSEVPVVSQVLPADTTTAITQPVLVQVDSTAAPVTATAAEVIAPAVDAVVPVVETVDPVLEAVSPVVAPVIDVVEPVVDVVSPGEQPVVVAPETLEPASTDAAPAVSRALADSHALEARTPVERAQHETKEELSEAEQPKLADPVFAATGAAVATALAQYPLTEVPRFEGGIHTANIDNSGVAVTGTDAGSAAAASAGTGSGPAAADAPSPINLGAFELAVLTAAADSNLPLEPVFNLGSTPD